MCVQVQIHYHCGTAVYYVFTYVHSLQRWPEAELHIIGNAGHSATEADIEAKLVEAADRYKEL